MKNLFQNTLITIAVFLIATPGIVLAQGTTSVEKIISTQAGNICLVNGTAKVKLEKSTMGQPGNIINSSYYVSLTPVGDCSVLKLLKKEDNEFIVQEIQLHDTESQSTEHCFDYVVFRKQIIEVGSAIKHCE